MAERAEEPFQSCLRQIYEEMRDDPGRGFGEIFQEKMRTCLAALPIRRTEEECFLRFAAHCGFSEGDMQIKWMEQGRDELARTADRLEAELAGKSRVALGIGAMSGLLLVILLL